MVLEDLEVEVSEPYNNEDGYEQTNTQRFFLSVHRALYIILSFQTFSAGKLFRGGGNGLGFGFKYQFKPVDGATRHCFFIGSFDADKVLEVIHEVAGFSI